MPYPDNFSATALDRHEGRDEDGIAEGNAALREARQHVNTALSALYRLCDVAHPTVQQAINDAVDALEAADTALVVELGT